jgi:thiol-disulfide isomerase/thioredoxin
MNIKRKPKSASVKKSKSKSKQKSPKANKSKKTVKRTKSKSSRKQRSQTKPTLATMNSYHDELMQAINSREVQSEPTGSPPTNSKPTILLVHAEWCGHCKALMPAWNEMMSTVQSDDNLSNKISIRSIETEQLPGALDDINSELNVDGKVVVAGYPTMGEIHDGKFMPYNGERDTNSLITWVKTVAN